jgi:hypothetical protein
MSDTNTRPIVGQEGTDPTTTSDENPVDFLERFARELDEHLPKVREAYAKLDARLAAEREAETIDPPPVPGLAFKSDGKTLLSIAYTRDEIPEGREVWTGVVLSEAEARKALEFLSDGADDGASRVAHAILYGARKDDDESSGGAA